MQPEMPPEDSLLLYRAMVEDLLDRLRTAPGFDLLLFFWPSHCRRDTEEWLGDKYALSPQMGGDLGDRMHNAFHWAHEQCYQKAIIVGSDIPMLDASTINAAFVCLDTSDVVLGPSSDGGYYLVGLRRPCRDLFTAISWSTNRVYEETLERIRHQRLSLVELDEMADLDTYEDVREFWRKTETSSKGAGFNRTTAVLSSLFGGHA
jgi:rSAM/selenodomain-associated transferase 1